MMRITLNGKRNNFSTNQFVEPKQWDTPKQRIRGSSPLVKEINDYLNTLASSALSYYKDCIKKKIPVNADGIKDMLFQKDRNATTLLNVFAHHIENLRLRVGIGIAANTIKKFLTAEKKIKRYLQISLKRPDVNLYELDHKFIMELDLFLRAHEKLKHNAVAKNMQQIKRVTRIAQQNGWLDKDPFAHYSIKIKETERGYLTSQELAILEKTEMPSQRLEQVKDVFVFCCYTGLSYADVSKLESHHFEESGGGMRWIKINRTKTDTKSLIPVLPKAQQILKKYGEKSGRSSFKPLPVISNQNLNKYLKEIAEICGIKKRISMHLARHTFATSVTLEKGVDITTVSKMLGHKNVRTTQIYSKVTELKIAEDVKKIMQGD